MLGSSHHARYPALCGGQLWWAVMPPCLASAGSIWGRSASGTLPVLWMSCRKQVQAQVKGSGSRARRPGLDTRLCHFLTV